MATQLQQTLQSSNRTQINADPGKSTKRLDTKNAAANETGKSESKKDYKKPAYLQSLNEAEKAENFKIIDNMNKKISFLKNPRFKVNKVPIPTNTQKYGEATEKVNPFRVEPSVVQFVDYQQNGVYEIPVKVTNASGISRRVKIVPPETACFTLKGLKYPHAQKGDIAPGLSVTFQIVFIAKSFADFDDHFSVISDDLAFQVPLRSRREPPKISLVNPMDCLSSWIGDRADMAFRCQNTGGDGCFRFFCERDEDDSKQSDPDQIKIGPFSIHPSEFYLYSGTATDIYVSFNPAQEGKEIENLILACDNNTSEPFQVTGYGAMLDLDVTHVDGKEVDFKKHPFSTFFFEDTNPTSSNKRSITIRNSSPILVPFHWSVFKNKNIAKITLQEEQTHYRVEPAQGKLAGGESITFDVYFSPDHAEPYYEFADLIVEEVPIQAIRDPPEGLKNFAAANVQKGRVPMPTYIGSNTQFLSIPMISFSLKGQGNACKMKVEPPVSVFEGDTFINHPYTHRVNFKKISEGNLKYKVTLEGKNDPELIVDLRANGQSIQDSGSLEGVIEAQNKELEFDLVLESPNCGDKNAYFFVEIEDGEPLTFQCSAKFRGPIVKLIEPVCDYQLVKINTEQEYKITLENQSPVPATIMIRNVRNKNLNSFSLIEDKISEGKDVTEYAGFKTLGSNNIKLSPFFQQLAPYQSIDVGVILRAIKPESVEEFFEILVKDASSLYFTAIAEIQQPKVSLNRNLIDLGKIYAGVTEVVDYDHKQCIVLKNFGNLPALFQWEENNDVEDETQGGSIVRFEPSRGTIPPKSEVQIYFSITVYSGGNINELFMCNIQDIELPLGFELVADSFGLSVSYESFEENAMNLLGSSLTSLKSGLQPTTIVDGASSVGGAAAAEIARSTSSGGDGRIGNRNNANRLQMLNFPTCQINKLTSQKFTLRNLSGIKTAYNFQSQIFEPVSHQAPQKKSEVEQAREAQEKEAPDSPGSLNSTPMKKGVRKVGFAPSVKSGSRMGTKYGEKRLTRAILSDEHEQTNKFSSATGGTFTATKRLEQEQSFFLSNNKGIAVVFNPVCGDLPPHSEVVVNVTIYNNVCGKFSDKFVSEIKGLPPVEFPINIQISGSPITIPTNQVGVNYNTIPPTLPMPTQVANSSQINKTFKIKNTGMREIEMTWRIFDQQDLDAQQTDYFTMDIAKNLSFDRKENPYKFAFKAIEPEESTESAFVIQPKNAVIGSKKEEIFNVTFDPAKGQGNFKSIVIATPQLSQEEIDAADEEDADLFKPGALGIVSMNLAANTIKPMLSMDKRSQMDGDHHIAIRHWSVPNEPEAPAKVRKVTFTNETKADLVFNLTTSGPFSIVKTKSNTGAKHPLVASKVPSKKLKQEVETMFSLQPQKIVEVHLKMAAPASGEREQWPLIMKKEQKGELVAFFETGDKQVFKIDGFLLRPKMVILTEKPSKNDKAMDEINMGEVHVEQFRTIRIYLSNLTQVTAKWQLNYVEFPKKSTIGYKTTTPWEVENMQKKDDPDVFEFQYTEGRLKGRSLPLRLAPEGLMKPPVPADEEEQARVPQSVLINFRPKENVLYKSLFRFTVENGISCDLILKGKGSYEENHD